MKIGDTFETAICKYCSKIINHVFWGNGGNHWEHEDGGSECFRPRVASPSQGTIKPVD